MTIKGRILTFLKEQGISREDFYRSTGLSASNFKGAALKSELGGDKIAKILTTYKFLSPEWLIIGEGSMLKQNVSNDKNTDNTLVSSDKDTINSRTNQAETSYIYKMYEKKDEEVKALIRENGRLEERIRQLESQDKEPESSPLAMPGTVEDFTENLYGDYGEGFSPTNQPITSKRSLAGKM